MKESLVLKTFEEVITHFKTTTTPYYFVSPTSFNLIGLDTWIPTLRYITFIDTFDKHHPHVMIPSRTETPVFNHLEEINEYLLGHKEIVDHLLAEKITPHILFLFFNTDLEALCKTLKLSLDLPSYALVDKVDSKIFTTQLGNTAGVASVPNVMAKVDSFETLQALAETHNLGKKWVVQTAYGDSGKTTFFISTKEDYDQFAEEIEAEDSVKVMKQIRCQSVAIEGCATRSGTFVGPVLSELIGEPSLTPYKGGWCGNDWHDLAFPQAVKQLAMENTEKLGDALYKHGYRGYFEVDYLIDLDTNTLYLGELNPRLSGVTALTNSTPFCQQTIPLFLFHVLEYSDLNWEINPTAYNQASLNQPEGMPIGQLIFKYTDDDLKIVQDAPISGVYRLQSDGTMLLVKPATSPLEANGPDEAFFFRIMKDNDYAYHGGDLAILFTPNKIQNGASITEKGKQWVTAVKNAYRIRELTQEEKAIVDRYQNPGARFK